MAINIPVVNAANLYVDDLVVSWASVTTLAVTSGAARDSTNVNDIILADAVTINAAVNGINGLDSGALAVSTMYAIHAVGDSSQNNDAGCMLSLSATAPVLPAGYDMFRRIGWVLTNGAAQLLQFYMCGNDKVRTIYYDATISELAGGAATGYTEVNLASSVPVTASLGIFDLLYTPAAATNIVQFQPFASLAGNGTVRFGCGVAGGQVGTVQVPVTPNGSNQAAIWYATTAGGDSVTLSTLGYVDNL